MKPPRIWKRWRCPTREKNEMKITAVVFVWEKNSILIQIEHYKCKLITKKNQFVVRDKLVWLLVILQFYFLPTVNLNSYNLIEMSTDDRRDQPQSISIYYLKTCKLIINLHKIKWINHPQRSNFSSSIWYLICFSRVRYISSFQWPLVGCDQVKHIVKEKSLVCYRRGDVYSRQR